MGKYRVRVGSYCVLLCGKGLGFLLGVCTDWVVFVCACVFSFLEPSFLPVFLHVPGFDSFVLLEVTYYVWCSYLFCFIVWFVWGLFVGNMLACLFLIWCPDCEVFHTVGHFMEVLYG